MSRQTNHENMKIRVIAIYRMLLGRKQPITSTQILRNLQAQYGITADRKTIYSDILAIDRFIPIESIPGKNGGYRIWDVLGGAEDGSKRTNDIRIYVGNKTVEEISRRHAPLR